MRSDACAMQRFLMAIDNRSEADENNNEKKLINEILICV